MTRAEDKVYQRIKEMADMSRDFYQRVLQYAIDWYLYGNRAPINWEIAYNNADADELISYVLRGRCGCEQDCIRRITKYLGLTRRSI
jgi:hypothetical protein